MNKPDLSQDSRDWDVLWMVFRGAGGASGFTEPFAISAQAIGLERRDLTRFLSGLMTRRTEAEIVDWFKLEPVGASVFLWVGSHLKQHRDDLVRPFYAAHRCLQAASPMLPWNPESLAPPVSECPMLWHCLVAWFAFEEQQHYLPTES